MGKSTWGRRWNLPLSISPGEAGTALSFDPRDLDFLRISTSLGGMERAATVDWYHQRDVEKLITTRRRSFTPPSRNVIQCPKYRQITSNNTRNHKEDWLTEQSLRAA